MGIETFKTRVAKLLDLVNPSRLVITRKLGDSIVIGNTVVTVVQIKGKQIRLGIIAESDERIERLERLAAQTMERLNDYEITEAEGNSTLG